MSACFGCLRGSASEGLLTDCDKAALRGCKKTAPIYAKSFTFASYFATLPRGQGKNTSR
ncbi:hypothetical protein BRCON_2780 [Candidatus Sumerlaea chitinivorans]|uniref:Uncharacterized protein n=1 Tax=Sumerlaea chitinivorans TaxID=2250252 RepID=A0A2Z4YA90_SUMC1|nr:hypothetical protein BRCON_2780 [Candidatus Sumerlaea chitinivorans]